MLLADLWYIHRERFLAGIAVAALAGALFLVFAVFGKGSESKGNGSVGCVPGADPIEGLTSADEFRRLASEEAVRVNPRLKELGANSQVVMYWWKDGGGGRGVYVSVFKGAWHGFNGDQRYDITSAAYGPGTVIQPTQIAGYKGYEQWVPRRPGHTVAFGTLCDQVGFYGQTEAEAKSAAENLLPLIDPASPLPPPSDSLPS